MISRAEWGARPAGGTTYMSDDDVRIESYCYQVIYYSNVIFQGYYLFVHHSAGRDCTSVDDCAAEVRAIQNYHMDSNGWSDIGYTYEMIYPSL